MNLRILKKLSKRAVPYLAALGDERKQFPAEKHENYHGAIINARKHAERWPSCHDDMDGRVLMITLPRCRAGSPHPYIKLMKPHHPRKGTVMVGAMSGYYEPEWDEECAFVAFRRHVVDHFTDWKALMDDDHLGPCMTRDLSTVSKLFAAANDILAAGPQPMWWEEPITEPEDEFA